MTYKFTNRAEKAIQIANEIAANLGHDYIGTEHLLYGLVEEGTGIASKVLQNQGMTSDKILEEIEELIGRSEEEIDEPMGFTPRTKRVIENAFLEAKKMGNEYIGTEHLLIGIMVEGDSVAVRIMMNLGINPQKLYNEIVKVLREGESDSSTSTRSSKNSGSYNSTPTLNQYGTDLTKQASDGKLDPVIGRKDEIDRVIQILSRRSKNNPCLIGEPGVGKTAVVEGLAEKIVAEDVPEMLKNKRVVTLDISSMVAGAKYRGDFEERIKNCLNEVKKAGDVYVAELFHGQTAAFKDMALSLLPHLMTLSLKQLKEDREVMILAATSGDTGKAALEGFKDVEGTCIKVFYPLDGVSAIQQQQMVSQEGKNVKVVGIHGNFDDAQSAVKVAFGDKMLKEVSDQHHVFLSSANSINVGRLIPQIVYYFHSYFELVRNKEIEMGDQVNFCVPSGNFGNCLAGWFAKNMGLPVNKFITASNKNNILTDFFTTGKYDANREFFKTNAPAMDILVSSNLERLVWYMSGKDGDKVKEYMEKLRL